VSAGAADKYSNILSKLHKDFCRRYAYLRKLEDEFHICPLIHDVDKAPDYLQVELIDCIVFQDST
jgi:hypothetical protein